MTRGGHAQHAMLRRIAGVIVALALSKLLLQL